MSRILISGQLHPQDGHKGCTFEVTGEEGNYLHWDQVKVTVKSPYGNSVIVSEGIIDPKDLGSWLLDQIDY